MKSSTINFSEVQFEMGWDFFGVYDLKYKEIFEGLLQMSGHCRGLDC